MQSMISRRLNRRQFLAATIGFAMLPGCGYDAASPTPVSSSRSAAFPVGTTVVSPDWLYDHIDAPSLRLLDLSSLPEYRSGHIPGASHIWWQDTIEVQNPVYGMLVNNSGRAGIVENAGIAEDSLVVCYDNSGGAYASRMIWLLQYMGFTSARLLNGGLQSWQASGYPITLDRPSVPNGGMSDIYNEFINAHGTDILARLDEPGLVILDTRTQDERSETWNGRLRKGQIPGSVWLPRNEFLIDGPVPSLVSPDLLYQRLGAAGVVPEETAEIITYGLHGTLASLPYVALQALEDFHLRLYDGSWAQWGANDAWPVESLSFEM